MSDVSDRSSARATLLRYAQIDAAPIVSGAELDEILDDCKRATTWVASTAYVVGNVILPIVRNGHRYRCTVAGTSGTAEPSWAEVAGTVQSESASSPSLEWTEDGADYENIYDVRRAAHEVWTLKTAKASQFIRDGSLDFTTIYDRCKDMATQFSPMSFG